MPKTNDKPNKSGRAATPQGLAREIPPVDLGAAAYQRLRPRLEKIPAERVVQPRTDVRAAASFVLSDTAPRLKDPALLARFASLPRAEFDHSAIEELALSAQAVLWAQAELADADAGQPGTRLPVELIEEAMALRERMLKLCAYHFQGDPRLRAQVDDIRAGQGYLDLAEDLRRLAGLYRAQSELLKQDLRFYNAEDAELGLQLSQRITSELRPQTGAAQSRDTAWRTWALLVSLYDEVARGARFLLRENGETAFPTLYSIGRSTRRRSQGRAKDAPPKDAPTDEKKPPRG